jgi:ribosomal protein S18 acetylase RimI-like enzyme
VRPATLADLPTVIELRLALLGEHGDNVLYRRLRPDAALRARRVFAAQLESDGEVTYLAEYGRRAVGILRCVDSLGSPLLYPSRYGYVTSVYVRPEARRRGVLKRLVRCAVEWAAARGLTELRLHNSVSNAVANAAWEALGFRPADYLRVRLL